MGGKSEIRVSLEDEPGAVSGSKWPQAETHQHAAGREPSLPSRCRSRSIARFKRHQLSSFVREFKRPRRSQKAAPTRLVDYRMIMLIHLENRSNHSASIDTELSSLLPLAAYGVTAR